MRSWSFSRFSLYLNYIISTRAQLKCGSINSCFIAFCVLTLIAGVLRNALPSRAEHNAPRSQGRDLASQSAFCFHFRKSSGCLILSIPCNRSIRALSLESLSSCIREFQAENILLMEPDVRSLVKIADFGLSKLIDHDSLLKSVVGTPLYVGILE